MNLRTACQKYIDENRDYAENTIRRLRYSVNRWERGIGHVELSITEGDFLSFRKSMIDKGLSPQSIEQTVYDIKVLLESTGLKVSTGKPLRRTAPSPIVPEVDAVGKAFQVVGIANWPRTSWKDDWWKGFLGLGLWTAFRLKDLLRIEWTDIQGQWLIRKPQKTKRHGLTQEIPLHPSVLGLLAKLPKDNARVLHASTSLKQLRRELERICVTAGVKYFTPHDIRRAGITMWSIAHPEAGRIIHGCGKKDVMQHYLSPRKILESAAPRVRLPQEMLPEDMRTESEQQEQEMLLRFKNAAPEQRELLIKLSRQLG